MTNKPEIQIIEKLLSEPLESTAENAIKSFTADGQLGPAIRAVIKNGYQFSPQEIFRLKKVISDSGWTLAHSFAYHGYRFTLPDLITMGNPANKYGATVAHEQLESEWRIAKGKPIENCSFTYDELIQLGNPVNVWGRTVAHLMARNGFMFSCDQIFKLGDFPDPFGITISLYMARNGHQFSIEEIIHLKNPADKFGASIAHWMARYGHRFSLDELLLLGNPIIAYSDNDLVENFMDIVDVVMDENREYLSKGDLLHNGATVSHIMAREGYRFSVDELKTLGNPKDAKGLTLADWMELAGNPLSKEEAEQLNQ